MLVNTFCHVPGIGKRTEERLWEDGFRCWEDCLDREIGTLPRKRQHLLESHLYDSQEALRERRPAFFTQDLPASDQWRLFPEFRSRTAYLDIETTGLDTQWGAHITTIALYDGADIRHYVFGENLQQFKDDVFDYDVLVTYNGKCFDIPFIENYFRISLTQSQIDLRYVMSSLGFRGGLKACEAQLGWDRGDLNGVDGYFAVLLWNEYATRGNQKALDTLLAYNIQDTVVLEQMMVAAYNLKIEETPFSDSHIIAPITHQPANPFEADVTTIEEIKRERFGGSVGWW